jgi:hypothetical protein
MVEHVIQHSVSLRAELPPVLRIEGFFRIALHCLCREKRVSEMCIIAAGEKKQIGSTAAFTAYLTFDAGCGPCWPDIDRQNWKAQRVVARLPVAGI